MNCEFDATNIWVYKLCQFLASAQSVCCCCSSSSNFQRFNTLLFTIVFSFLYFGRTEYQNFAKINICCSVFVVKRDKREKNARKKYMCSILKCSPDPSQQSTRSLQFFIQFASVFSIVDFFYRFLLSEMFALVSRWFSPQSIWISISVMLFSQFRAPMATLKIKCNTNDDHF